METAKILFIGIVLIVICHIIFNCAGSRRNYYYRQLVLKEFYKVDTTYFIGDLQVFEGKSAKDTTKKIRIYFK